MLAYGTPYRDWQGASEQQQRVLVAPPSERHYHGGADAHGRSLSGGTRDARSVAGASGEERGMELLRDRESYAAVG
jgi:hypothetical protein